MSQPVLRTPRVLLTPLSGPHLDHEIALDADPEVLRYLFGRARTRAEVVAAHAERLALAAGGLGYWAAFGSDGGARGSTAPGREEDGEFLGLMMLPAAHGDEPATAELGYRLHRRYWRQGLAGEASRELLRHAFEDAGQRRVIAQTMFVNRASRAVMESLGMRHTRTFVEVWDDPLPDSELGEVEYEITREQWADRRTR